MKKRRGKMGKGGGGYILLFSPLSQLCPFVLQVEIHSAGIMKKL
jgi:hypothetical protein